MTALGHLHHGEDKQLADHSVLLDAAAAAGLEREEASKVLKSNRFASDVRKSEMKWMRKMMTPGNVSPITV